MQQQRYEWHQHLLSMLSNSVFFRNVILFATFSMCFRQVREQSSEHIDSIFTRLSVSVSPVQNLLLMVNEISLNENWSLWSFCCSVFSSYFWLSEFWIHSVRTRNFTNCYIAELAPRHWKVVRILIKLRHFLKKSAVPLLDVWCTIYNVFQLLLLGFLKIAQLASNNIN